MPSPFQGVSLFFWINPSEESQFRAEGKHTEELSYDQESGRSG